MHRIKIPQQEFALKMQGGGLMREGGGAYLWDTTVTIMRHKVSQQLEYKHGLIIVLVPKLSGTMHTSKSTLTLNLLHITSVEYSNN